MLNDCNFIGNLGADVETRYTAAGDPVSTFSVACTEKWKSKSGEMQEQTEWVRCTCFGRQAKIASEYLEKGSRVHVNGKMKTDKWDDQSGVTKYSTGIIVRRFIMLSPKGQQSGGNQGFQEPPPMGEDIPF